MDSLDHNHHCILTVNGFNYWILKCEKHIITICRDIPSERIILVETLDTSHVDWGAYCKAAAMQDEGYR